MPRKDYIIAVLPDGSQKTFFGRVAWTLRRLIEAGRAGVTTLEQPAPRWSDYVFKLRKAGLTISTEYEQHRGDYPGTHGRYRLETAVELVEAEEASHG